MRRYSEAVKADVRRRMSPPMRQSVAQISAVLPSSSGARADASDCFAGMFVWLRWFSNQGHGPAHPLQRQQLSRVPELRAQPRLRRG